MSDSLPMPENLKAEVNSRYAELRMPLRRHRLNAPAYRRMPSNTIYSNIVCLLERDVK